jgi:hypothetical protein
VYPFGIWAARTMYRQTRSVGFGECRGKSPDQCSPPFRFPHKLLRKMKSRRKKVMPVGGRAIIQERHRAAETGAVVPSSAEFAVNCNRRRRIKRRDAEINVLEVALLPTMVKIMPSACDVMSSQPSGITRGDDCCVDFLGVVDLLADLDSGLVRFALSGRNFEFAIESRPC